MWQYGELPDGWRTEKIGEYASVITDYVANGSFAALAKNVDYKSEPDYAVLIRLTDYNNDFDGNFVYIDKHAYNFLANSKLYGDEIIISNVGANVGTVFKCPRLDKKMSLAPNAIMLKTKGNDDFYYYWFTSRNGQHSLQSIVTGSAQPKFNKTNFKELLVPVPPLKVQKKIAEYLGKIDQKIEFNKRINKNLEQQAEALFHSLFIENANPTWKDGVLSDLGTVVAGGTPSKTKPEYYSEQGIAWITPKDLSLNKSKFISRGEIDISELGFSKSSATKMPTGTVLFSSRAPIGYIAIAANEVTTNQGFKSVVPNENVGTAFMYYLLKFLLPTIEGMASGSTFKEISGAGMKSVPVVIPDNETIEKFNACCTPIFQQQDVLEAENSRLADIRDALLPKLMSGELDVSDIDL